MRIRTIRALILTASLVTALHAAAPITGAGNCLQFDGINDVVVIPYTNALDLTSAITLTAWVYPESHNAAGARLIDKTPVGGSTGYLLDTYPGGRVRMIIAPNTLITAETLPLNTWTHVAATYDASTGAQRIYWNGELKAQADVSGSITTNTNPVVLGTNGDASGNWFHGRMDEVEIWSEARTQEQITEYMYRPAYYTGDIPVVHYDFNVTSTITVPDRMGVQDATALNITIDAWVTSDIIPASWTINEGERITFFAGFDPDGTKILSSHVQLQQPSIGYLTVYGIVGEAKYFTYAPQSTDTWGADSFVVRIADENAESTDFAMDITILPVNDVPTASSVVHAMGQFDTLTLSAGSDVDGESLTVTIDTPPAHGTAAYVHGTAPTISYVPDSGWCGVDTLAYHVTDSAGASGSATVVCTVYYTNKAPSFTAAGADTSTEDAGTVTVAAFAGSLYAGAPEETTQAFTFVLTPADPTFFNELPAIDPATGALTYAAAPDVFGSMPVRVRMYDDGGTDFGGTDASAPDTFVITVLPVNDDPPQAATGGAACAEDDTLVMLAGSDPDGDLLFVAGVDSPAHGTLLPDNGTGFLRYRPAPDFNGTDHVRFTVTDTAGLTDTGLVTVTVTPVDDAPVITSPAADTAFRNMHYYYLGTCLDVDGEKLTYAYYGVPYWLAVYDSVLVGTPPDTAATNVAVTLTVSDGALYDTLVINLHVDLPDGKLSVNLAAFSAADGPAGAELAWTTDGEVDNLGWDVERSTAPLGPFDKVNTVLVPGAGTVSGTRDYAYTDSTAANGLWYYRLVQHDVDGTVENSYTVAVSVTTSGITVLPGTHAADGRYDVRYFDMRGRPVAAPGTGVYLRVQDGKAVKTLVVD